MLLPALGGGRFQVIRDILQKELWVQAAIISRELVQRFLTGPL